MGMFKKDKIKIILLLTALMAVAACSTSDDVRREVKRVRMPVYLSIPAGEIGLQTRAPGDPGTYEKFELPDHITFFFIVNELVTQVVFNGPLVAEDWEKVKIGNDYVYTYMGDIGVNLPDPRELSDEARIYIAVSKGEISFPTTLTTTLNVGASEDDVLNLKFNISDGTPIKDIYSSPYNWEPDGEYYGTVKDYSSDVPYVSNFILYHVAAKLDVIWNVDDDLLGSMYLKEMKVLSLKKKNCFLFKPMANTTGPMAEDGTAGGDESSEYYDESVPIDDGNRWYGRQSFYVISYGPGEDHSIYPVKLKLKGKNDTEKEVVVGVDFKKGDGGDIFTPWVVAPVEVKTVF